MVKHQKHSLLEKRNETGCPPSSLLLKIALEVLAMAIRQEKDWKIEKKEKMVLFYRWDCIHRKGITIITILKGFCKIGEDNVKAQK